MFFNFDTKKWKISVVLRSFSLKGGHLELQQFASDTEEININQNFCINVNMIKTFSYDLKQKIQSNSPSTYCLNLSITLNNDDLIADGIIPSYDDNHFSNNDIAIQRKFIKIYHFRYMSTKENCQYVLQQIINWSNSISIPLK